MIFQDVRPCVPLQEYLSVFRIRHFIIPPNLKVYPKAFPPHPEQCITFYPRGTEITEIISNNTIIIKPRSIISGQFTQRINRSSLHNEILIIVAVFKPGVLHRLTGIPFYELKNKDVDLEAVFPKRAREVKELLSNSGNYAEMIFIIEHFLLELTAKAKIAERKFDKVFNLILPSNNKYSLSWLANEACTSPRQFERITIQYIGINPKLFSRIARFNQTYRLALKYPKLDWLSIAIICGYHDYQHLAKDYKKFVNTTPKYFFQEEYKSLERVLDLNPGSESKKSVFYHQSD